MGWVLVVRLRRRQLVTQPLELGVDRPTRVQPHAEDEERGHGQAEARVLVVAHRGQPRTELAGAVGPPEAQVEQSLPPGGQLGLGGDALVDLGRHVNGVTGRVEREVAPHSRELERQGEARSAGRPGPAARAGHASVFHLAVCAITSNRSAKASAAGSEGVEKASTNSRSHSGTGT